MAAAPAEEGRFPCEVWSAAKHGWCCGSDLASWRDTRHRLRRLLGMGSARASSAHLASAPVVGALGWVRTPFLMTTNQRGFRVFGFVDAKARNSELFSQWEWEFAFHCARGGIQPRRKIFSSS